MTDDATWDAGMDAALQDLFATLKVDAFRKTAPRRIGVSWREVATRIHDLGLKRDGTVRLERTRVPVPVVARPVMPMGRGTTRRCMKCRGPVPNMADTDYRLCGGCRPVGATLGEATFGAQ